VIPRSTGLDIGKAYGEKAPGELWAAENSRVLTEMDDRASDARTEEIIHEEPEEPPCPCDLVALNFPVPDLDLSVVRSADPS